MLSSNTKYSICKLLITSFFCLTGLISDAQAANSNNYLELTANHINFNLTSPASLENQQVVPNAITVKAVSNRRQNYTVQVSGSSMPSATPIPLNNLGIKLRTTSSTNYADYSPKFLTTTNQIIGSGNSDGVLDSYVYDLILSPIGYNIAPGTYSFTLLFTMTQQ